MGPNPKANATNISWQSIIIIKTSEASFEALSMTSNAPLASGPLARYSAADFQGGIRAANLHPAPENPATPRLPYAQKSMVSPN